MVATEYNIDVFTLNTGEKIPKVCHLKNVGIKSEFSICENMIEHDTFYIAIRNHFTQALINLSRDSKVQIST